MYRLLPISKDTYITNKIVAGSGSITSNVGQAGTLDLFKIYTSPVTSSASGTIELSRVLLQPDLSELRLLTGSILNINNPNFKCYLSLKAVYGGQTTPSNFTLSLVPLAKSWDEGRGLDIRAYRDLDAVNWVSASTSTGTPVTWSVTGANGQGNLGDASADFYLSGNLGIASQSLEVTQVFSRGDENLLMDVTNLVSASLAGILPEYGWRLAYSGSFETNDNTYFVKRFGSRHVIDKNLMPKLVVVSPNQLEDDSNDLIFGVANTIRTYNYAQGSYANWLSGSSQVTGSNCATLHLVASKSISFTTSSYFTNFSGTITYTTSSISYISYSFSSSQTNLPSGYLPLTGYYESSVTLNPQTDTNLRDFLAASQSITFQSFWKSNDNSVLYSSGSWLEFYAVNSFDTVSAERNFVLNIINLKVIYSKDQVSRLKVFIQDRNTELPAWRLPFPSKSLILRTMYWRLIDSYSKEIIIPFDDVGTKLSSDGSTMYFDLWLRDLESNKVYDIEFKIEENGQTYFITNEGFRFKVIP